jgi:hypothetical protein
MTANEHDASPDSGVDDVSAVNVPEGDPACIEHASASRADHDTNPDTSTEPDVPDGDASSAGAEPVLEDTGQRDGDPAPVHDAGPAEEGDVADHSPVDTGEPAPLPSRAQRRAATKTSFPVVPTVLGLFATAAVGYSVVDVLTDYADTALPPVVARIFLVSQIGLALVLAVTFLITSVRADRRAERAAENPSLDEALAHAVALRKQLDESEQARASVRAEMSDLNTALATERARNDAAAAAVRTARAQKDQALADLARFRQALPPNEADIREQVSREIAAAHQVSLAELDTAHERMVSGLKARIAETEGAAEREAAARLAAEASVTEACETTRAEERARMRITVQALETAAKDTLGDDAAPVTLFAQRFVEAVERLDGPAPAATPAMPIRAVASRAVLAPADESTAPSRLRRFLRK